MKHFVLLILTTFYSLCCFSQRDNTFTYERISKKYFKKYFDNPQRVTSFDRFVNLADTIHFNLYYKSLDAQLLFYIWGLNDLFVLIDNRIYQLAYNQTNDTFSKVEL